MYTPACVILVLINFVPAILRRPGLIQSAEITELAQ